MKAADRVRQKILMCVEGSHGENPTSLVVSRDIYYELKEDREIGPQLMGDKLFGMLISVLQGEKNNQILLFK